MPPTERFFVTTPMYYVNDVPHLGTAYSTIAADVFARYHRVRGQATFFLTGTDEHGLKLERSATERNLSPRAFADEMNVPFREAWPKLACAYDHFVRTTDPEHQRGVSEIWSRVKASGDLYLGAYEGWYCVGCEAYYTEKELEPGGVCPIHKTAAERIREASYFFKLSAYADRLLAFYDRHPEFVVPVTRLNEVKSFVRGGLEDLSVSRTTFSWGIPVPDDPSHVMYVWFDALFSYLTPMLASPERKAFWPPALQVIGKDILRFHAVYWPAFLMSLGMTDEEIPKQIFAHGFLTFGGHKMSKSLRNTVKPEALADAFGVDTLRYYLMRAIAFGQDGDFNVKDLVQRYNAELGNALGNLLNRVLKFAGKAVHGKGPLEDIDRAIAAEVSTVSRAASEAFGAAQPHRALEAVWQLIGAANQYIDRAAPWSAVKRGDAARAGTILTTAIEVLGAISVMIWPVMPSTADLLRGQLGLAALTPAVADDQWPAEVALRRAGDPLGEALPLFPRIDPDRERALLTGLGLAEAGPAASGEQETSRTPAPAAAPKNTAPGTIAAAPNDSSTAPIAAAPPNIAYDDFAKVDLRIGHVLHAERVPGKDKLLSLRVDVGEAEPRAIVAGLALTFRPEDLVGRRVVVVANLEPRKFGKGLVSHGMLLATGPSETLKLVTVDDAVVPGAPVK